MQIKKVLLFIGIAFVLIGGIIAFDMLTRTQHFLTCTFEVETYQEKMTFEFYQKVLIKFDREEFALTNSSNRDSLFEKYKEKMEGINNNDYFNYTATQEPNGIRAHTYIYLPINSELFNQYFSEDMDISRSSTIDHIKEVFVGKGYKCSES